jgi:hypothetical protein
VQIIKDTVGPTEEEDESNATKAGGATKVRVGGGLSGRANSSSEVIF